MPEIFNRQRGDIPELDFNYAMACISEVFGERWLQVKSSKRNLIKELWQRRDFVSSMELFIIGSALRKIVERSEYQDWLEDFVRKVKSSDDGNAVGAIYEAVMYSMLANNPAVTLAPPAQAGFDFTAQFGEGVIRYSCKRLQVSDEEKKSRREFEEFRSIFKATLLAQRRTGWHVVLYGMETGPLPKHNSFEKAVLSAFQSKERQTQLGNFRLFLKQLSPIIDRSRLNLRKLSYATTLIRPMPKSEQNRFQDLFRRAAKNLTKHSPNPTDLQINALMIGLPESISIEKAKKWVEERFEKSDSSRIAMVILTKFLPAADLERNSTLNSLQVGFCINNNCDSASIEFIQRNAKTALKFAVPIGSVSEEPAHLHLAADGAMLPLEDAYIHQSSEIHHEMDFELPFELNYSVPQDTRLTVTLVSNEGSFELEPITPREFRYVIM
jgi:hypothetical protein